MNSSIVSVYDNVSTLGDPSRPGIYSALNDLFNVNTDLEVRIFCPLCENNFSFKFSLFEHLRTFHYNFLIQISNQPLKFRECPFCNAKFYGKHLTAKHVLHHHYKVIKGLFVNKNKFKCVFCNEILIRENYSSIVKHIEELHFSDFAEEFKKMFSNDTIEEIIKSDLVHSTVECRNSQSADRKDLSTGIQKHLGNTLNANMKHFDEASETNCYDFTDLKQQLDNLKNVQSAAKSNLVAGNRSILKDFRNSNSSQKSVRRVLRFDIPSNVEDKENSVFNHTFFNFKQINIDEYSLLCNENKSDKFNKCTSTICGEPQHYSTPKSKFDKILKHDKKESPHYFKSHLKSEKLLKQPKSKMKVLERKAAVFGFQCGKCRLLFEKNSELVCHVKNNHKFSLNALQPCYHCAICNARFYKNCYLKKHHNNLHKPY